MRVFSWGDLFPPRVPSSPNSVFLGAAILSIVGMPASAQLADHDRIEYLFAIVQGSAAPAPVLPMSAPDGQSAPEPSGLPAPAPLPVPMAVVDAPARERGAEMFDYELPDASLCPRDSLSFRAAVDEVEQVEKEIGRQVADLEQAFDALSEDMIATRSSVDFECSQSVDRDIDALAGAIASFDAGQSLARTEVLATCAQEAATRIEQDMNAIPPDAPRNEIIRRTGLSRQLDDASRQDARLTSAMISLASMKQKQLRLSDAVGLFRQECADMRGAYFGSDLTDYE